MITIEIAWLAGLLEGEGTLSIMYPSGRLPQPYVALSMTDLDVVERAAAIMGCTSVFTYKREEGDNHYGTKTYYTCRLTHTKAVTLMELLYPQMSVRRQGMMDRALDYWKSRPGKRRGENHPSARFSEVQIREMRKRYDEGETNFSALARDYDTSPGYMKKIITRQTWKHLE